MKIAILGAGAYGTALGGILAEKGYDVDYYDPKFKRDNLSEVLDGAGFILLSTPSFAVPHLLPYLNKNIPLIIATKGFLSTDPFKNFKDCMIISGPGYADDIKAHKETKLTATDKRVIEMFETDYLEFDYTNDEKGVLMCGALKNVYAIYAGVLGLKPESKKHDEFLNNAVLEMKAILKENGANPDTVDLACGKEDLRITCYLPSRNYEFGVNIYNNKKNDSELTVEGISALKRIKRGEIMIPEKAMILREIIKESDLWF